MFLSITGKLSLELDEILRWVTEREQELATELPQLNSWNVEELKKTIVPYTARLEVCKTFCLI